MMGALNEVLEVRQIHEDAPRRRWLRSDDLDLIVWCDESGMPRGFPLCYDKPRSKHTLTWLPELGFLREAVSAQRLRELPGHSADGQTSFLHVHVSISANESTRGARLSHQARSWEQRRCAEIRQALLYPVHQGSTFCWSRSDPYRGGQNERPTRRE